MDSPAPGSASTAKLPPLTWLTLALIFALSFGQFWLQTTPVRFSNTDDVAFQAIANAGQGESHMTEAARDQARFYFATPILHRAMLGLYEVRSPGLFSLGRTTLFFLQVGLLAWLAARVFGSAAGGALVALFIAGTLHVPPTFYPILSFPSASLGCCALLAALLCHHAYLREPRFWSGGLAGALFLFACLMQDFFVLFLPAFAALSLLYPRRAGWAGVIRENLGPLVAAGAFLAVYRAFAREFPTSYEGTQLSLDFVAAGKILVRQMVGITPGFELLVNRPPAETTGPLFRTMPEIVRTLGDVPVPGLLLGLAQAGGITWMLRHCLSHTSPVARHWPWLLVFAVALNLPIAFSEKYQVFIFHREYPYVYGFYSFLGVSLALAGAAVWLGQRVTATNSRRLLVGAAGALAVVLCVSAQASNHRVLKLLRQRFDQPGAVHGGP